jgi:hypothetical protein
VTLPETLTSAMGEAAEVNDIRIRQSTVEWIAFLCRKDNTGLAKAKGSFSLILFMVSINYHLLSDRFLSRDQIWLTKAVYCMWHRDLIGLTETIYFIYIAVFPI